MKTIHRIFVGILCAIITTNCFGGNSQLSCGRVGNTNTCKCQFCAKNNYMESYTNEEGMVVELNPYTFFTVVAGWQKAANNDKIYWCIDFEDPSVGYDNLRKAFESTSDVRLQCYEMDGASLAITNQKADPKYSDIKIQGGQLVQKVVENILSNKTVTNPDLITCKPCPNGGETKDWSGWEGIWNNAAQQCEPASNKHHYYTIANCKGYQRDEKGTYEWVNQSGNNVTSLKCYYTE